MEFDFKKNGYSLQCSTLPQLNLKNTLTRKKHLIQNNPLEKKIIKQRAFAYFK